MLQQMQQQAQQQQAQQQQVQALLPQVLAQPRIHVTLFADHATAGKLLRVRAGTPIPACLHVFCARLMGACVLCLYGCCR
jgi:hypothetical protein